MQLQKWRPEFAQGFEDLNLYELGYPPQFGNFLERLHKLTQERGYQLTVRDYNYVDSVGVPFIWPVPQDCSLDLAVYWRFAIQDFLLVRHPADQLASSRKHKPVAQVLSAQRFLEGYCQFLKARSRSPRFRYEDFIAAPEATFRSMCECLGIQCDSQALSSFRDVKTVTGNLERLSEGRISLPQRSLAADRAEEELASLPGYRSLLKNLGYKDG